MRALRLTSSYTKVRRPCLCRYRQGSGRERINVYAQLPQKLIQALDISRKGYREFGIDNVADRDNAVCDSPLNRVRSMLTE